MKHVDSKLQRSIMPSPYTQKLMEECGYNDFEKFVNDSIEIAEWLIAAKRKGRAVGAFDHKGKKVTKLYHPMLEVVSAKADVKK